MYKEIWCVGLGQEGDYAREGVGNCLKHLKREWNRKEEQENKNLKKGRTS